MMRMYRCRHLKRTLVVTAIIGCMWYIYVTKNEESRSRQFRRDEVYPLSLQERMQEELAARQWLAETRVRMEYSRPNGPATRTGDPYSPNRIFSNAPQRTYYISGSNGNQIRTSSIKIEKPYSGGSVSLENHKHSTHAHNYPDDGQANLKVPQGQLFVQDRQDEKTNVKSDDHKAHSGNKQTPALTEEIATAASPLGEYKHSTKSYLPSFLEAKFDDHLIELGPPSKEMHEPGKVPEREVDHDEPSVHKSPPSADYSQATTHKLRPLTNGTVPLQANKFPRPTSSPSLQSTNPLYKPVNNLSLPLNSLHHPVKSFLPLENDLPMPAKPPPTSLQLSAKTEQPQSPEFPSFNVNKFLAKILNSDNEDISNNMLKELGRNEHRPEEIGRSGPKVSAVEELHPKIESFRRGLRDSDPPEGPEAAGGMEVSSADFHHLRPRPRDNATGMISAQSLPQRFLPLSLQASLSHRFQRFRAQDSSRSNPPPLANTESDSYSDDPLRQRERLLPGKDQQENERSHNSSSAKKSSPSSDDLQFAALVSRDKTHWKVEKCLNPGQLTKATLTTPLGRVGLYLTKGNNDFDAINNDFGLQWNMRGIGTFFDRCLLPDKSVSLLDIGAGVGQVTFTAAALGRQVYAIEPKDDLTQTMCKSLKDFDYKNVHLIHNAVSEVRGNKVSLTKGNKSHSADSYFVDLRNKSKVNPTSKMAFTIKLDDLLRLYKITSASLRLDVEDGFEGRVLAGATKFLSTVAIPCILMEWKSVRSLKEFGGSYVFQMLSRYGFMPHDVNTLQPLKVFRMHDWPQDVLWAKLGSYPVKL